MSNYINTLHPPVPPSARSPFSSLSSAHPNRRRVPQLTYTPASKWKSTICSAPDTRPISFDISGYNGIGIPMRELCVRGGSALDQMMYGARDPVLAHYKLKRIQFVIQWPGYTHVGWIRPVEIFTTNGAPISRAQLAVQIAQNYARFIEKTQYESIQPSDAEWRIGLGAITFDRLVLMSLWNAFDDVWQAEVALEMR